MFCYLGETLVHEWMDAPEYVINIQFIRSVHLHCQYINNT